MVKKNLKPGDALYFSHGFSIAYRKLTGVVPPKNVDVIMVAPKGSGTSVRRNFLTGAGINSSFAVEQDATGRAKERCLAIGIGIGSGYLFPTTFQHEVFSDLTGERGVLMGALAGIMEAQYDVLRAHKHSPSEAFNETVEELTQSLIRLVDENGMDWMYSNCSATAQRGALDWKPRFKKAVLPVFKELYERVKTGKECARVLSACGKPDYQKQLGKELAVIGNSEMWQAGKAVRALRPKDIDSLGVTDVAVIGGSMGAAVGLQAAADDTRIQKVVAIATFSDLRTVARERAPFFASEKNIHDALALAEQQGHFVVDDVSSEKAAARLLIPVLVVHGADDHDTPPAHSQRVYAALKGPKRLLLLPGAGHSTPLSEDTWKIVDEWLAR
jgi:ketol-acid reductoisomerase